MIRFFTCVNHYTHQYFVTLDLALDLRYAVLLTAVHGVVTLQLADLKQEVLEHGLAVLCKVNLWVELHAVQALALVCDG